MSDSGLSGLLPIVGPPTASLTQAMAYARQRRAERLAEVDAYLAESERLALRVGIDPGVVWAQWADETGVGTSRHWIERLNPAGIGVLQDRSAPVHDLGYRWAGGKEAAAAHVVHLLAYARGYDRRLQPAIRFDPRWQKVFEADYAGRVTTVEGLAGTWATNPNYAGQIRAHLLAIRAAIQTPGPTPPAPGNAPLPAGIVWHGTGNWHERTFGQPPVALVYHITDDPNLANVIRWFQDPRSNASAHVVIDRDGTIHQFVSSTRAAWTNGDVNRPRRDVPWLNAAVANVRPRGPMNLNDFTLNVEHVARRGEGLTGAQYAATVALSAYWRDRYGLIVDRGHCLRHADINSVDRPYCPGSAFDLARVIRALGGDPLRLAA
jgi:hypothetical protein